MDFWKFYSLSNSKRIVKIQVRLTFDKFKAKIRVGPFYLIHVYFIQQYTTYLAYVRLVRPHASGYSNVVTAASWRH